MATNKESVGPLIQDYEKRSFQFLALCVILTAMLFIPRSRHDPKILWVDDAEC